MSESAAQTINFESWTIACAAAAAVDLHSSIGPDIASYSLFCFFLLSRSLLAKPINCQPKRVRVGLWPKWAGDSLASVVVVVVVVAASHYSVARLAPDRALGGSLPLSARLLTWRLSAKKHTHFLQAHTGPTKVARVHA